MKQHKIKRRVACEGKYKIMVGKKPGGIESEQRIVTDWFTNLITDGGLNHLGTSSFSISSRYCQVGEGSTTPSVEDVNLTDHVAYTNQYINQHSRHPIFISTAGHDLFF